MEDCKDTLDDLLSCSTIVLDASVSLVLKIAAGVYQFMVAILCEISLYYAASINLYVRHRRIGMEVECWGLGHWIIPRIMHFFRIYLHYISFALHLHYICISHSPQNRYICITFH